MERRTLELQLEAITDALAVAQDEPDPHRQDELLAVVYRAWVAYLRAHRALPEEEERQRHHLRLVPASCRAGDDRPPDPSLAVGDPGPHRSSAVPVTCGDTGAWWERNGS